MAAAQNARPNVGDILVVIHDFQARSSDELTLSKGDRVELLERDDEFGDGWFLGKQLVSGNTGLFPEECVWLGESIITNLLTHHLEVYTRPSPNGLCTGASALSALKQTPPPSADEKPPPPYTISENLPVTSTVSGAFAAGASGAAEAATTTTATPASTTTSEMPVSPTTPTAKSMYPPSQSFASATASGPASAFTNSTPPSVSGITGYSGRIPSNHDSQVLHETLNVIDEHITDLRSPSGGHDTHLHAPTDSGSEYSSNLDHRMSYIHGEETDEEEDGLHTRSEVESWTPDDVAEYLFTVGVEKKHCEVFRDQEITGEVVLEMDQASLFIKAFDLGPVGRRLKTWQKIKALQDEVNGHGSATANRRRSYYGSDIASEDARRSNRSRTNTLTGNSNIPSLSQRLPPINDRPISIHTRRLSVDRGPNMEVAQPISPNFPSSPRGFFDSSPLSPRRSIVHEKRPSAASVRDLHHSRRHSSTDYRASIASSIAPRLRASGTFPQADTLQPYLRPEPQPQERPPQEQHKKQPSFDRNWTLGNAGPHDQPQHPPLHRPLFHNRPLSSAGIEDVLSGQGLDHSLGAGMNDPNIDLDRGYFSGPDMDTRRRSLLEKKTRDNSSNSPRGGPPVTGSSYTDEQRVRSATALSWQSRFGSVDSVRDPSNMSSAAQTYYGLTSNGSATPHRRTTSTTTNDSTRVRPALPPKDKLAPTVTKLDDSSSSMLQKLRVSPASPAPGPQRQAGAHGDWFSAAKPSFKSSNFGLRALSDAVTGHDRNKVTPPVSQLDSSSKDSPVQSPSRTGSSTPSAGPSFELDSPDPRSPSTTATMTSGRSSNISRKKGKKETSAYQRGLLKISPREAIKDADYSGWMKKKSSNLMASWKPRLFVLKGRRLAYYYSEDDDQERGLIDISFHRVLPADNERLTGLHATLTGALTTPTIPPNSNMTTLASAEADAEPFSSLKPGTAQDSIFIFKLVPPRAGLSRAVNFTKPMVHYFAVPNVTQGRLWMAALMKATIDRDDAVAVTTTYQQKTISLAKARQMRHRPPALMNLDEKTGDNQVMARNGSLQSDDVYEDGAVPGDDGKRIPSAATTASDARNTDKAINGLGITYKKDGVTPSAGAPESAVFPGSGNMASNAIKPLKTATSNKVDSIRTRQFVFEPEKDDVGPS
ncbi:hypothetical protein SEPCBS119000_000234 [Sporothrix epigloea]|uniref:Polarized growth protein n=1 Tax=Sporothrix epigloea TaxID=1892477 RepID=A0ABP0D6I0_9PEZI